MAALGAFALAIALAMPATSAFAATPDPGQTSVHVTWFFDATHLDQTTNGAQSRSDGADMERFYIDVQHGFSQVWSARLTTDINWLRNSNPTDLWVKYAYLQGAFSKAFTLRIGSAPTPWVGFANQWYGYRFIEKELVMRTGTGISADWGVHALGRFGSGGQFDYAVSVITGGSYKQPHTGHNADVESRFAWQPTRHTVLALGSYQGHLAEDRDGLDALRSARRWDALAAYADARWRIGVQYFHADDWGRVVAPAGDASRGWSLWGSVQLTPRLALFARHDEDHPSLRLAPSHHERYSNAGVAWNVSRDVRLALAWKRESLTSAGASLRSDNEFGVWSQITL